MKPATPKQVLSKHGLRPKRSWSQNFLADASVAARIADEALRVAGADGAVLELGAGTGALTRELAARVGRVVALERDRDMAGVLRAELAPLANVAVREDNALTVDVTALASGGRLTVVGNLPYHIASQIVFHLLEHKGAVSSFILMLQAEMAVRICAGPGTKDYGVISALCALHTRPQILFTVAPGAFHPRPRVDSAVVRFDVLASPAVAVRDERAFRRVVKAAFSQRRKTLRNALRPIFPDVAAAERALAAAGIDPGLRGETLDIAAFARLADASAGEAA
jgi:16S rRNA (adenine1518-N6/adenine1519-N6)-dimethyltransferase